MALQIRRGTETQRQTVTFLNSEPAWVTDSRQLYIGQDSVLGGILVGGKTAHILEWQTLTLYTIGEIVFSSEVENDELYICLEEHTSGVFETDLTALKWKKLIIRSAVDSFVIADWTVDGEVAYIDINHGLNTLIYNTTVFENSEQIYLHKIETTDENTIRIYITKDDEFDGDILIQK